MAYDYGMMLSMVFCQMIFDVPQNLVAKAKSIFDNITASNHFLKLVRTKNITNI